VLQKWLIFFLLLGLCDEVTGKWSLKDVEPGIYMEERGAVLKIENKIHLIFKLDLNELKIELDQLKNVRKKIEVISYKENVEDHFKNFLTFSDEYIKLLESKIDLILRNRAKRGIINFVGAGAKLLFGTMDNDDRAELNEKLSILRNENDKQEKLNVENAVMVSKALTNVATVATSCNENNKLLNAIQLEFEKLQLINENIAKFQRTFAFVHEMQMVFTYLKDELEDKIRNVKELVEDFHNHLVNTKLVGYQDIFSELRNYRVANAEAFLPFDLIKPEIEKFRKLVKFGLLAEDANLLVVFMVPLISKEKFSVVKAFPVPKLNKNLATFVQVTENLIIFDENREKVATMKQEDFDKNCVIVGAESFCEELSVFGKSHKDCLHQVLYDDKKAIEEHCDTKVIKIDESIMLKTSDDNKFLVFSPVEETGKLIVNNEIIKVEFNGTQLLQLEGKGKLILKNHEVNFGNTVEKIETKFSLLSKFEGLNFEMLEIQTNNIQKEKILNLKDLNEASKNVKEFSKVEVSKYENGLMYGVVAIAIIIIVVIAVVTFFICKKKKIVQENVKESTLTTSEKDLVARCARLEGDPQA
jgi:hypothetical protein